MFSNKSSLNVCGKCLKVEGMLSAVHGEEMECGKGRLEVRWVLGKNCFKIQ